MAKMYGQLPSYIKEHATVYDMTVTDAILSWEKEQYDKASGKPSVPKLSVEDMKKMFDSAKKS